MNKDWQDVTKEKIEARKNFITEWFPEWKKTFCSEMGRRDRRFLELEDKIVWRIEDSMEYTPMRLCTLYFHYYRPRAKYLMEDPEKLLDRHKIVALTQQMILEHFPVTYSMEKQFSRLDDMAIPKSVRLLNVSFAYHFALEFLRAWNKEKHEKKLDLPFDSDALFECLENTEFAREHQKLLALDWDSTFPTPLISQLWYSLEQWGLTHMRK